MQIQIDSREKPRAIKKILREFEKRNVPYFVSKLYVGDYQNLENPLVFVDRKQNIAEIAQNATSGHKRFKAELERVDKIGAKMYVLIEQNEYDGKKVESLEDIILWKPKYGTIVGVQIFKVLQAWTYKHNVEFVFCSKAETGKKIIELLGIRDG